MRRESFPVDDIKRTLDAMSWVKVNITPPIQGEYAHDNTR